MYIGGMDAVVQAISDDSRRSILASLREGPATVTELAATLVIARPGVSRHLRILREAGLVEVEKDAQRRIYRLHPEPLVELDEWLAPYRAIWQNRMDALHTEVARGRKAKRND
jgi:DNA-binding transcriptional ArsR family regulator